MTTNDMPRWATGFVLPILNLLSALLVAALVIHLLGEDPLESMQILINSAIVNPEGLSYTLFYASTFVFTGLAVSVAMQAGLFNIGAEGQMYFGGLGLTLAMLAFDATLPWYLLIPAGIIGAALFGALWAFIPGYLQARRGSHIVVTTIMFNFICASLINFVIVKYLIPPGEQNTASRVFSAAAEMPRLNTWFPVLGDTPLNVSFLFAIVALVIYGVAVWRSSWGYKLRATGLNKHAAHYAGVKISAMIIATMAISGALAGLGSVNSILGATHYLSLNFVGGAGFVG
ncbi:MAG TPA: ABC transporter permease, partial [Pseudoduganella sp.]